MPRITNGKERREHRAALEKWARRLGYSGSETEDQVLCDISYALVCGEELPARKGGSAKGQAAVKEREAAKKEREEADKARAVDKVKRDKAKKKNAQARRNRRA